MEHSVAGFRGSEGMCARAPYGPGGVKVTRYCLRNGHKVAEGLVEQPVELDEVHLARMRWGGA